MPIEDSVRLPALQYIDAHLLDEAGVRAGFSFITDPELLDLIVLELKSARYIYRLMEMLDLRDTFSHPFCKFQIVQYAGVFEAAIEHLLFDRTYTSPKFQKKIEAAREKLERHSGLVTVAGLSAKTSITYDGKPTVLAQLKQSRKSRINIPFEERLRACEDLGLIDTKLADEILEFYKKRNSVHLTAKILKSITVELSDTRRGFRRINAFCEYVKRGLTRSGEPA